MLFLKNRIFLVLTCVAVALLVVSGVLVASNVDRLPSQIIIHFDRFHGIDLFGSPSDLWWLFGVVAVCVGVDVLLAHVFFERDRAISYILAGTTILLGLLLLIAVITILSVN